MHALPVLLGSHATVQVSLGHCRAAIQENAVPVESLLLLMVTTEKHCLWYSIMYLAVVCTGLGQQDTVLWGRYQ